MTALASFLRSLIIVDDKGYQPREYHPKVATCDRNPPGALAPAMIMEPIQIPQYRTHHFHYQ